MMVGRVWSWRRRGERAGEVEEERSRRRGRRRGEGGHDVLKREEERAVESARSSIKKRSKSSLTKEDTRLVGGYVEKGKGKFLQTRSMWLRTEKGERSRADRIPPPQVDYARMVEDPTFFTSFRKFIYLLSPRLSTHRLKFFTSLSPRSDEGMGRNASHSTRIAELQDKKPALFP